jgi:hypothetical protein
VFPPSVDNKIFTAEQFTDPPFVPFTFQLTVAVLPALQVILELGDVTWKGPAVLVTVTTTSVKDVCPTEVFGLYTWLSLTVNRKFKVLETELSASILTPASPPVKRGVTRAPERIVDNRGNILVGDVVGLKESQFGPVVLVGDAILPLPDVVELSFCSQQ